MRLSRRNSRRMQVVLIKSEFPMREGLHDIRWEFCMVSDSKLF
jgi:hypothetical protein